MNKIWNIPIVDTGDGELGFEIPDEIMDKLDLSVGDTIIWEETEIGGWKLTKKSQLNAKLTVYKRFVICQYIHIR